MADAERIAGIRVQVTSVKVHHHTNKVVMVEASNQDLMTIRFVTSFAKAPKAGDAINVEVSQV